MPHVISDILGENHPHERGILSLEGLHGSDPVDVNLIGQIASKSADIHREFSLDPSDTTSREFYHSALQHVRSDNDRVAGAIGGEHSNAVTEMNPLIIKAMKLFFASQKCFAIRSSVIKKIIKVNPPVEIMKLLHYRSVDSLIKHESMQSIIVLARYIESDQWNQNYRKSLVALRPQDFEIRDIQIMLLDKAVFVGPLEKNIKKHHLVLHAKEMGVVAIAPTKEKVINSYTIRTISLITHYINEILTFSSYIKHLLTHPSFGKDLHGVLSNRHKTNNHIGNIPLNWRTIHRHMEVSDDSSELMPHTEDNDWKTYNVGESIKKLNPHVSRWKDLGFVVKYSSQPVSCNIIDLSIDDSLGGDFDLRSLKYVRIELESELMRRYLESDRIRSLALRRLRII